MKRRPAKSSPILSLAGTLIDEASETLVVAGSRFRHSFEADLAQVDPDPDQPRRNFGDADIAALAVTMREAGQLQPILLRRSVPGGRRWTIVAGERRWRAARLNGWTTILAIELDGDPEVASLLENLQRVDLAPHEEARALQRLIGNKGWTQEQAAGALGRSKAEVSATLRILTLPDDVLRVLTSEHLVPRNVLVELARIDDPTLRDRLVGMAREGTLTIRGIRVEKDRTAPPDRMQPMQGSPRPFSFRSVETLAAHLRRLHRDQVTPSRAEKERLLVLQQVITDILEEG